jgi:hypothetical protein
MHLDGASTCTMPSMNPVKVAPPTIPPSRIGATCEVPSASLRSCGPEDRAIRRLCAPDRAAAARTRTDRERLALDAECHSVLHALFARCIEIHPFGDT